MFCFFAVSAAKGQTEERSIPSDIREKEAPYHPQSAEKPAEQSSKQAADRSFSGYTLEKNGSKKPKYKELGDEGHSGGETSSEEVSTLSFNIFLYVLDRFKED
ncbi:hypothetical protein [Cyclobacterium xiamenense]|jgi:hypothetical protein|uniref:hypothetical protein n=1 Tax=Cyclobacterium xiamenense TaxID=1297121 RepID=UPI0035CFE73D